MSPHAIHLPSAAKAAIERGDLIQAIKIVREATGLDLKEAKQAVQAYAADPEAREKLQQALGAKAATANLVLPQVALDALAHGQLIEAIKQLREANPQLGLKEAKEAVEAVVHKHAGKPQRSQRRVPTVVQGDSGRDGWLWLVAAALAGAVAWWWLAGR